jgi:hypothetical protein
VDVETVLYSRAHVESHEWQHLTESGSQEDRKAGRHAKR